jgi:hypothetical protein
LFPHDHDNGAGAAPSEPVVFILIGGVRKADEQEMTRFYAFLNAPDDDGAVRKCLESLAQQGFEEADLDQIGVLTGLPDEPEFHEPYRSALKGDVGLMLFAEEDGD